jgi:plasmid stability protein
MRTTVDIPDTLYRQLRTRAARDGRTAKALILEGVERVLAPAPPPRRRRVTLPLVRAKAPGSLRIDNARIYDVISFP